VRHYLNRGRAVDSDLVVRKVFQENEDFFTDPRPAPAALCGQS
jgi:hypothetical protein